MLYVSVNILKYTRNVSLFCYITSNKYIILNRAIEIYNSCVQKNILITIHISVAYPLIH